MARRKLVEFSGEAAAMIPDADKPQFEDEIGTVMRLLLPKQDPPELVTVRRCFTSFTTNHGKRAVFGVEVRTAEQYQTHIVKVGVRDQVEKDWTNWHACTRRGVASRIFIPVRPVPLPDRLVESTDGTPPRKEARFAVVYQDGYRLFGLNPEEDLARSLENIASDAIHKDAPGHRSVERAISQVYADLGRWFYPKAVEDRERRQTLDFYRDHLKLNPPAVPSPSEKPQDPVLTLWAEKAERRKLRRDAVWIINGREKPDLDPEKLHYVDPVEYIGWVVDRDRELRECGAAESAERKRLQRTLECAVPATLVGPGHGDLHARNILLGVRRGEAEYPVVFDYGDMGLRNVLAWDFAKLETELLRRLLPPLLEDDTVRQALARASKLRPEVMPDLARIRALKGEVPTPLERDAAEQRRKSADRIRAALEFQKILHLLTCGIDSKVAAESVGRTVPDTGHPRIDRLLCLLLKIRAEAACWLGFERSRNTNWRDELYFALAVYGLINVRWNYDPPEQEVALVAAGAAVARMSHIADLFREAADAGPDATGPFPGFWVPLAITHRLWLKGRHADAAAFLKREVNDPSVKDRDKLEFLARPAYQHAIPLIGEAFLLQLETGGDVSSEKVLEDLRPMAVEFGDFETLGRLGRLLKDSGDRRWAESREDYRQFANSAGWKMYRKALTIYSEAFESTGEYYVGINAATLAYLTHDLAKAQEYAEKVAEICKGAKLHDHLKDDRFWIFATEGEAALLGKNPERALSHYRNALQELNVGQGGMANSAYKQLCRIARAMGEEKEFIASVLALFESSEFRDSLSKNYVGRNWPRKSPAE